MTRTKCTVTNCVRPESEYPEAEYPEVMRDLVASARKRAASEIVLLVDVECRKRRDTFRVRITGDATGADFLGGDNFDGSFVAAIHHAHQHVARLAAAGTLPT